eukprot:6798122-Alexandrium_andersonii.AAC.1
MGKLQEGFRVNADLKITLQVAAEEVIFVRPHGPGSARAAQVRQSKGFWGVEMPVAILIEKREDALEEPSALP